jgi:hypothetical protein
MAIAQSLADALRTYPCMRVANYNGDAPVPACRHCEAIKAWDAWLSTVQRPKMGESK